MVPLRARSTLSSSTWRLWGRYTLLALAGVLSGFLLLQMIQTRLELAGRAREEMTRLRLVAENLQDTLAMVRSDALVLAWSATLTDFLDADIPQHRTLLARSLLNTLRYRPQYDHIRLLDATGLERLRVQWTGEEPQVVEPVVSADPASETFFLTARRLDPGQFHISSWESAAGDQGRLTLRVVTPAQGQAGRPGGLVVINYPAAHLLESVSEGMRDSWGQPLLLDDSGKTLYQPRLTEAAQPVQPPQQPFYLAFPRAWQRLQREPVGQFTTPRGLFSYRQFRLDTSRTGIIPQAPVWYLVSRVPAPVYWPALWANLFRSLPTLLLLLAAAPLGSIVVARLRVRELAGRARFRRLVELQPDGLVVYRDNRILYANPATGRLLGTAPEQVQGTTLEQWVDPTQRDWVQQRIHQAQQRGSTEPQVVELHRPDGRRIPVETRSTVIEYDDGQPSVVALLRDVTERQRLERLREELLEGVRRELQISEARLQVALKGAPLLVFAQDRQLRYQWVENLPPDWPRRELIGLGDEALILDPRELERVRSLKERVLADGQGLREEITVTLGERIHCFDLTLEPLLDPAGTVVGVTGAAFDISERKGYEAELSHRAHHDDLTGLPNRLLLRARLEHAINRARREFSQVAVLFLDLDHFKKVNDTLGHGVGDALLRVVAVRLVQCVRNSDTVARQAGDEFIMILERVDEQGTGEVADKVLATLADPLTVQDQELFIGASIGISLYPRDGPDAETLLKHADVALYRAKARGRNTFRFYDPTMNRHALERLHLEKDLHRALSQGELLLHFQPQVDLAEGRVAGVEALLRWHCPRRGFVPPARFIPLAEDNGLILPIGEWVLRRACAQARTWQDQGLGPLVIAVNLSTRQFIRPGLAEMVGRILEESGLPPGWLELEITESLLMEDLEGTTATLRQLQQMGVMAAIDDFGTGYSSLAYLKRLPLNRLKIDKSFVQDLEHNPDDAAITQAIIALAHSLGLAVVAEGVETRAQWQFLREHRCDLVQGYLVGHPAPAEEITRRLGRPVAAQGR